MFKNTVNIKTKNINFFICFTFRFNNIAIRKLYAYNTIQINFILVLVNFFPRLTYLSIVKVFNCFLYAGIFFQQILPHCD